MEAAKANHEPGSNPDASASDPELDGLRGCALVLVLLYHYDRPPPVDERAATGKKQVACVHRSLPTAALVVPPPRTPSRPSSARSRWALR